MIEFTEDIKGIKPEDLEDFFKEWKNKPSQKKRYQILKKSDFVILAVDKKKVVGFINAITDKTLTAYIPLLEVHAEYRNRGIGSELVKRMLHRLKQFYMIDLCCDEKLEAFYKKHGMEKTSGMIIRNYNRI